MREKPTNATIIHSQKALGTLSKDGNVMPKYVGTPIHNQ
jgi:hypothetical protein